MQEQESFKELQLFYLLNVIRDVKRQQPDKSLIEMIYAALAQEEIDMIFIFEDDNVLCDILSKYHDKIYQEQQKIKLENPGD